MSPRIVERWQPSVARLMVSMRCVKRLHVPPDDESPSGPVKGLYRPIMRSMNDMFGETLSKIINSAFGLSRSLLLIKLLPSLVYAMILDFP